MAMDIRAEAAQYYDLSPAVPDDIPFYRQRIVSPEARLLELGCGTGRVLLPLADSCRYIQGVDASAAMLSICREKLEARGVPASRAAVVQGDITELDLGSKFDLITAPFRVFQNLETDAEVEGFFETVRRHLAPDGSCILNVFKPNLDPARMRREWRREKEQLAWEVPIEDGRVTCHDRKPRMDREKLVLYPELIYRRYRGEALVDEVVLKIVMRCYYPEGFRDLITDQGFRIVAAWGGYQGEAYGEGSELVVQFAAPD